MQLSRVLQLRHGRLDAGIIIDEWKARHLLLRQVELVLGELFITFLSGPLNSDGFLHALLLT